MNILKCIILEVDGTVKEVPLLEFFKSDKRNIQYVLFPNPDDDNFFIVEDGEMFEVRDGSIEYDMFIYSYDDPAFSEDDKELAIDVRHNYHEIHSAYDLYCAIFSILKMNYALELFFNSFIDDESIECFCIDCLSIRLVVNGDDRTYEWKMGNKGSIFSRMKKLVSVLYDTFHIPHHEFEYSDRVIKIKDNMWKSISFKKVKEGDLIGFVGNDTMTIQFITASEFNLDCIENQIELEFYGLEFDSLKEEYPKIEERISDSSYTSKIDVGLISEPTFFKSVGLTMSPHQRVEFLGNTKYLCKYIEAYTTIMSFTNAKLDEVTCIINASFVDRRDKISKDKMNNENRIETNLTKYNPYILK